MASEIPIEVQDPTIEIGWKPYRLSVEQFLAMIDAGIFPQDAHVELLGGVLIQMMVKGDQHDYTLCELSETLRRLIPEGWLLREDKSLRLGPYSRPEPDIAVVRGPRKQYQLRTPDANETAFVVEVAESSYAYDRGVKWRAYASAKIPIYWIVNLSKARVEVYQKPTGKGSTAHYQESAQFLVDETVPVFVGGQEVGRIALLEILA